MKAPLKGMRWTLTSDFFEELVRHVFLECTKIVFLSGVSCICSRLLQYNL